MLPRFTCFYNKILSVIVEESSFHKEFNLQILQCDLEYTVQISPERGTMLNIESHVGLLELVSHMSMCMISRLQRGLAISNPRDITEATYEGNSSADYQLLIFNHPLNIRYTFPPSG